MESIGKFIRSTRLAAGLSLEEISARTRIPVERLEAIENDQISAMPSFFYRSFVRQFASALNLDPSILDPLIENTAASIPEPLVPGQDDHLLKHAVLKPSGEKRSFRWLYPLASLIVVLVGCSFFSALWEKETSPARTRGGSSKTTSDRGDGFRVELSALEPTWLSISADGRTTFSGTLETEQKKSFEGRKRGRLKTVNAGGISFVFNGKPIGVLGPRGQVRTVVFTRDRYEVLRSEEPVALTSFIRIFEWRLPPVSRR